MLMLGNSNNKSNKELKKYSIQNTVCVEKIK